VAPASTGRAGAGSGRGREPCGAYGVPSAGGGLAPGGGEGPVLLSRHDDLRGIAENLGRVKGDGAG